MFQFFLMICSLNYLADVHLLLANLSERALFLPDAVEILEERNRYS